MKRYEEEDGSTPLDVRRGAWWSCLAGAAYTYGHRDNWKSPRTWREWINSPGAKQIEVLGKFLRSLARWMLVPDQTILIDGKECATARAFDGRWILAYLPARTAVTVSLESIAGSKMAVASWIKPAQWREDEDRHVSNVRARL